MDNQHRKITGYRELNQHEVDAMNKVKELGIQIGKFIDEMPEEIDKRWRNIGKTHLQEGIMALTRSITQPDFF